jgi:hypothetical protein
MATKPRRKRTTISIRTLERKDKADLADVELQAEVARLFHTSTPFDVVRSPRYKHNVFAIGTYLGRPWSIELAVFPIVGMDQFNAVVKRTDEFAADEPENADELWLVAKYLSDDVLHVREETHPSVRVLTIEELEEAVKQFKESPPPDPTRRRSSPRIRTRIGKAVLANADQLRTAATTSIVLIEERLDTLSHSRPNSEESKQKRDDEVHRLTVIRTQLEALRDYPELLKTGQVKETVAVNTVRSFSQGISEYWSKHTDAICEKMLTFGLFSSLVLVGQLTGTVPEFVYGLAGAAVYGKPVVDSLKAMKGFFRGK